MQSIEKDNVLFLKGIIRRKHERMLCPELTVSFF